MWLHKLQTSHLHSSQQEEKVITEGATLHTSGPGQAPPDHAPGCAESQATPGGSCPAPARGRLPGSVPGAPGTPRSLVRPLFSAPSRGGGLPALPRWLSAQFGKITHSQETIPTPLGERPDCERHRLGWEKERRRKQAGGRLTAGNISITSPASSHLNCAVHPYLCTWLCDSPGRNTSRHSLQHQELTGGFGCALVWSMSCFSSLYSSRPSRTADSS
ncbi:uncharacterized protein LOC114005314 [Tupaia chinensis]|uniref:uncharacterized protein LOC114005314 n=1 Tax=Tupaia chinensis TaxID=246437 RepID=UPI000FFB682B|nr:uncharacterized protein LOC114005314 [Tupaia chinensis]